MLAFGCLAHQLKLNAAKTELFLARSLHSQSLLTGCGLSLQLDANTVVACDHVRLLGGTMLLDLGLHKHVSSVCVMCF